MILLHSLDLLCTVFTAQITKLNVCRNEDVGGFCSLSTPNLKTRNLSYVLLTTFVRVVTKIDDSINVGNYDYNVS
jgi:hypothetical protein